MASSITKQEATHRSIVKASGPPNVLGPPLQAKNGPRLFFLPSPGPENSPNDVENGLSPALASITPERQIQQPTDQAPQPSSTKYGAILAIMLPNHCARPTLSNIPSSRNAQNCSKIGSFYPSTQCFTP